MGFGQIFFVVLQSEILHLCKSQSDNRKNLGHFLFMRVYYFKIFTQNTD